MNKQDLQKTIGEEFTSWADMYFTEANQGKEIDRKEMYDNFLEYIGPARRPFYSPMGFKVKLIKYCELRDYILNPQRLNPSTGEYYTDKDGKPSIDIKHDGREFFVIEKAILHIKFRSYPKIPLSSPSLYTFVDLGLPSGRLWATENAPGFYTFDEAVDIFGELLPKGSAMVELIEESEVSWNREKKGLDITGPNGNTIFLPADGYRWEMEVNNVKLEGDYWTRMPYSQSSARYLYFYSGGVHPLYNFSRSRGFSVRPCREL